jgi:hypothetical protein
LLILLPFVFFTYSCGEEKKNETNEYKKNRVASKIEWDYKVENGIVSANGIKAAEVTYNKEGKKLTEVGYDEAGEIYYRNINHYNTNNQLISTDFIIPPPYSQHGVDSFFYNKDGKKISGKHYNSLPGENQTITKYYYDKKNNLIKTETFNHNGDTLLQKEISEFDDKGQILTNIFTSIKVMPMTVKYAYNNEGQLIETSVKYPDLPLSSTTYYYNDKGLCIRTRNFHDQEKKTIIRESKYTYTFY